MSDFWDRVTKAYERRGLPPERTEQLRARIQPPPPEPPPAPEQTTIGEPEEATGDGS